MAVFDEFDEFESKCEEIREQNIRYLNIFKEDLVGKLQTKTINRHLDNVDFYINDFLLHEEPLTMQQGAYRINSFLGEFFIRKCMWSTPATIKSTAASIKKFYKCMAEHGEIDSLEYEYLCFEIKAMMPEWQSMCAQYNDLSEESPFFMW